MDPDENLALDCLEPFEVKQIKTTKKRKKRKFLTNKKHSSGKKAKQVIEDHFCPVCLHNFATKSSLNRHELTHQNVKKYVCEICGAKFSQSYSLKIHLTKLHTTGTKQFKCKVCKTTFQREHNYKNHIRSAHPIEEDIVNSFKCPDCDVPFCTIHGLSYHIRNTHSGKSKRKQTVAPTDENVVNINVIQFLSNNTQSPIKDVTSDPNSSDEFLLKNFNLTKVIEKQMELDIQPKDNSDTVMKTDNSQHQKKIKDHTKLLKAKQIIINNDHTYTATRKIEADEAKGSQNFLSSVNKSLEFSCSLCDSKFSTEEVLQEHLKSKDSHSIKCQYCPMAFPDKSILKIHSKNHSDNKKYSCTLCTSTFRAAANLRKHLRGHSSKRDYRCPYCDEMYKSKCEYRIHLMKHKREILKIDPDELIGEAQVVDMGERIEIPEEIVSGDDAVNFVDVADDFDFPIAGEELCLNENMSEDIESNKIEPSITHDMLTAGWTDLPVLRGHTIEPVETSPEDNKKGNRKNLKIQNESLTTDTSSYKCRKCTKSFAKSHGLERHMISHSKEKPFECHVCGKPFPTKFSLHRHVFIHNNPSERVRFNCTICKKSFTAKQSLELHIRIHTGQKPFSCKYCPKKFRTSGTKAIHIKNKHPKITI